MKITNATESRPTRVIVPGGRTTRGTPDRAVFEEDPGGTPDQMASQGHLPGTGAPSRAITNPWRRPAEAAAARAMTMASQKGTDRRHGAKARTAALKPYMTDATDKSISPLMMTKVMAMTTMIFSANSQNRLTKFPPPSRRATAPR